MWWCQHRLQLLTQTHKDREICLPDPLAPSFLPEHSAAQYSLKQKPGTLLRG